MVNNSSSNYFYKNGKRIIKKKIPKQIVAEDVDHISSLITKEEKFTIAQPEIKKPWIKTKTEKARSVISKIKNNKKSNMDKIRVGVTGIWASASVLAIFTFLTSFMVTPQKARPQDTRRYSIYSSKPLTLQTATTSIYSKDSRAQKINSVYKKYNCPLEGMGDVLVYEADKNNIPWWLVAAVSFQESGCGKVTPKVGGKESYNAWGWGVYGDVVVTFENWVRGIERVSKYFSDKFYSKGVEDLCIIMNTYTPPSNGSWCNGVKYFGDMIQNYETK